MHVTLYGVTTAFAFGDKSVVHSTNQIDIFREILSEGLDVQF